MPRLQRLRRIAAMTMGNARKKGRALRHGPFRKAIRRDQAARSTIIFLICAMAAAGFRPFGQVLAQFMIVWQR